jgi:hypothetical protein
MTKINMDILSFKMSYLEANNELLIILYEVPVR